MSKNTVKASNSRISLQRKQYRILDQSTRNRRNRQQLEQLERDNFHDDPHANLVMHKKAPKFEDVHGKGGSTSNNVSSRRYNISRSRLFTLNVLIEESSKLPAPNYVTILTRSLSVNVSNNSSNSCLPKIETPVIKRNFCSVCGFKGNYTCIVCGLRYCCSNCLQTHVDTRCLKWTG